MRDNLRLFFSAICREWVFLLSRIGSVFLAVLSTIESKPLPKYLFAVTAVACLFVTAFRVWQKEHSARESLWHSVPLRSRDRKKLVHSKGPRVYKHAHPDGQNGNLVLVDAVN